jgi:hypothetical protein
MEQVHATAHTLRDAFMPWHRCPSARGTACAPELTRGARCESRWKSTQDAALARELHALPDVREPLSRAEVHRRQERLRRVVQPLRSWIAIYLKICREPPYGLDLAHVLKTKLGNTCRQHMTPLRKVTAGKAGTRRSSARMRFCPRAGANADEQHPAGANADEQHPAGANADEQHPAGEQPPAADACASPLPLAPSEDDALQSPCVLLAPEGDDGCDADVPCAWHDAEMRLWH